LADTRERAKNGKPHLVPLPPRAVELIKEALTLAKDDRKEAPADVFPSRHKAARPFHPDSLTHAMAELTVALGIKGASPHDQRSTGSTALTSERLGVAPFIRRAQVASEAQINAALALLGAIAPRDELETVPGEQIVAAHVLSMELMHQAKCSDTIPKMEAYTSMATKLSRSMATHIDALGKLRSGGKQQVIVKHVYVQGDAYVGDSGQAVFGGFDAQGGGPGDGKPSQTHESGVSALRSPEVRGEVSGRVALPASGHEGS
jgi:hypothetical protein